MKEYKKWLAILTVTVIGVPVILWAVMTNPVFPVKNQEWIGFWGGYLGSVIGGAVTIFVLVWILKSNERCLKETLDSNQEVVNKTIEAEKRAQERNEVVRYCEYVTDIISEYCRETNDKGIYLMRYLEYGDREDIYHAMHCNSEMTRLSMVYMNQLIAKCDDPSCRLTGKLLESLDKFSGWANSIQIRSEYSDEEREQLIYDCDKVGIMMYDVNEAVLEFLKANLTDLPENTEERG